eukprot:jgi/Astpho2/4864/fgenesh1_pg.00069_%23_16_t
MLWVLDFYLIWLRPTERLIDSLKQFVAHKQIQAGMISTCVGSLQEVVIRFANQEEHTRMQGHFEIVSLTGTFSVAGHHVHISVSDRAGATTGGHLIEGTVYTTAEMVVTELAGLTFGRETDDTYGFKELAIT